MQYTNLLSDFELVDLAKQGDDKAFALIYERYWTVLFIHADRMLGNEEDAKDLVQTFFYNLFVNLPKLTFETSFSSYVYRGVRNMVLDYMKHQNVIHKYLASFNSFVDSGILITDHEVRRRELEKLIEDGISSLPTKMQEIFRLSRMGQLSHREIAEKLGISENTVKSQINNALRILRKRLGASVFLLFFYHNNF